MTGGLYSNVSSHATGFFPAASVVWHIKIHGRESGNDLSTLGIMELLTLNLIQSVSPLQPCTCQSQISVLSCRSSATIAGASIGNCCPTHARAMKILRTPLAAPRRWPRIDSRLHERSAGRSEARALRSSLCDDVARSVESKIPITRWAARAGVRGNYPTNTSRQPCKPCCPQRTFATRSQHVRDVSEFPLWRAVNA